MIELGIKNMVYNHKKEILTIKYKDNSVKEIKLTYDEYVNALKTGNIINYV